VFSCFTQPKPDAGPQQPELPRQVPHPHRCEEADREQRGRLHQHGRRGHRDPRDHPAQVGGLQRDRHAGHQQADHQRVVVPAGHEVREHQRVEQAEPQRVARVDAVRDRQAGQVARHQQHAGDREQPHAEHRDHHVIPGHHRDQPAQRQPQRPVRRGRVHPHPVDLVQERPRQRRRADRVRVEARVRDLRLRGVGVEVAGEQRDREQQRQRPQRADPQQPRLLGAGQPVPDRPAQVEPGHAEHGQPDVHQRERDLLAGALPQQRQHRHPPDRVVHRQRAGAERAQHHQHRADQPAERDQAQPVAVGQVAQPVEPARRRPSGAGRGARGRG
jgi:hypothetical protein